MTRRLHLPLVVVGVIAVTVLAMAGVAWAAPCGPGCPIIKNVSPLPNSTTSDATPKIAATVKDRQTNLAKKHIKLFVDGVRVTTFSYNRSTDRLSYTPAIALANGRHTAKIVATDNDRKTNRKSWAFTVHPTPPVTTAPTVVSYAPHPTPPPRLSTNVTVTFSKAMNSGSITDQTFTLTRQGSSSPEMAQVTYDSATLTATLDPDSNLSDSATYTALVKGGSNGVKDLEGESPKQDYSWTFMPCDGGLVLRSATIVPQLVICG